MLCGLMASLAVIAQSFTAKPGVTTCPVSNGYYEYLPQGYNNNPTEKFPLIVFNPPRPGKSRRRTQADRDRRSGCLCL